MKSTTIRFAHNKSFWLGLPIMMLSLIFTSCAKEENNETNSSEPDEYYVRYELETTIIGRDRDMDVMVWDENNDPLIYNMRTGGDLEVIVGPVGKGFNAKIQVNVPQYTANLFPRIFVSKNNAPFAIKGKQDVSGTSVTLTYVVDF